MNAVISDKHRVVWFINPKTGTESVKASNLFKDGRTIWFDSTRQIAPYEQYYKVAVVRNPWDRLVSCYLNKKEDLTKEFKSFEHFIWWLEIRGNVDKDRHWMPQHKQIPCKMLDKLFKFDYLPHGFREVCNYCGISATLPHTNKSEFRKPYRAYYNPHTADIVRDLYAEDLEKFGFDF